MKINHSVFGTMYALVSGADLDKKTFGMAIDFFDKHKAFDRVYLDRVAAQHKLKRDYYYKSSQSKDYFILLDALKGSLSPPDEPVRIRLQYYSTHPHTRGHIVGDISSSICPQFDLEGFFQNVHDRQMGLEEITEQLCKNAEFKITDGNKMCINLYQDTEISHPKKEDKVYKCGVQVIIRDSAVNNQIKYFKDTNRLIAVNVYVVIPYK